MRRVGQIAAIVLLGLQAPPVAAQAGPAAAGAPPARTGPPTESEPTARREPSCIWRGTSLAAVTSVYAGVGTWAFFAWYDRPPNPHFEFNEDGWFGADTYAGGSDKLGHLWSNLALTRLSADVLEAGTWSPRASTWMAAGLTTAFFTAIEIKDAYYYAFSWGDMAANVAGAATAVLFREFPGADALLDLRVSYWPSRVYRREGGANFAEDYSGQIYLLALHLEAVTPQSWVAVRYVDVVAGYGTVGYKPDGDDRSKRREPFLGVTLNLGQVLDDATSPEVATATQPVTEHVNVPFTALPLLPLGVPR